jgi:hypothetical protein
MLITDDLYNCGHIFKNHCSGTFSQYVSRSNKKKLDFNLTKEQFDELQLGDCYMCGKETTGDHINGIDRINNKNGYLMTNCLSCCHDCNKMKNEYVLTDVIRKMYKTVKKAMKDTNYLTNEKISFLTKIYIRARRLTLKDDAHSNKENIRHIPTKCSVTMKIYKKNAIEKYGQEKFNKIRSLETQIQRCKDSEKKKLLIDEKNKLKSDTSHKMSKRKTITKEEKRERAKLRKQKQREKQKQQNGEDNYKFTRAQDQRKYRQKKKEDNN